MKGGRNIEGYSDPTASIAVGQVSREESEADKRAYDLIKVLKYVIRVAGFELTERVQLKDSNDRKGVQIDESEKNIKSISAVSKFSKI